MYEATTSVCHGMFLRYLLPGILTRVGSEMDGPFRLDAGAQKLLKVSLWNVLTTTITPFKYNVWTKCSKMSARRNQRDTGDRLDQSSLFAYT